MSIQHAATDSPHKFAYVSAVDPGAVGRYKAWAKTGPFGRPYQLYLRNSANTAWLNLSVTEAGEAFLATIESIIPLPDDIIYFDGVDWATISPNDYKAVLSLNNVPNVNATLRANHTGTQLAATISNLSTTVNAAVAAAIAAEGFGELAYQDKATVDITGGTIFANAEGLGLASLGTKNLVFKSGETLSSADRILNIVVDDNNRTFTLTGDLIVAGDTTVLGYNTGNETTQTIGDIIGSIASAKTTPVDADVLGLADSAALFEVKQLTWANAKKRMKAVDMVTETNQSTTMAVTRLGKLIRYTHAGALDTTIPGTGTLGTDFIADLFNGGDSNLTIIAGGGVTLIGGGTLAVNKLCTIRAITTNTYKITGENT